MKNNREKAGKQEYAFRPHDDSGENPQGDVYNRPTPSKPMNILTLRLDTEDYTEFVSPKFGTGSLYISKNP